MSDAPAWETYEQVAAYLLDQARADFGLSRVEGKQPLEGASGTTWTIDAKGMRSSDSMVVIVECRRYTGSRIDQESTGGLAFRIQDTGAGGGILVSPLGLQEGAAKVAAATGIIAVIPNADATPTEFTMSFLNQLRIGVRGVKAECGVGTPTAVIT